jgi:hypothetical protein
MVLKYRLIEPDQNCSPSIQVFKEVDTSCSSKHSRQIGTPVDLAQLVPAALKPFDKPGSRKEVTILKPEFRGASVLAALGKNSAGLGTKKQQIDFIKRELVTTKNEERTSEDVLHPRARIPKRRGP